MSDQPLTVAVFEKFQRDVFDEFQRKVFGQFVAVADRFDVLEAKMDARFDDVDARFREVTGQIDGLSHRLLRLEQESVLVNAALKRLEAGAERTRGQIAALDKRLRRMEKRIDGLVTATPRYARRTEVQELRGRVADLKARVHALEKRRRPRST